MTAEIGILNKKAIAVAADSAVTIQGPDGPKIFTSANKIFQISETAPIGIMIFQMPEFMWVPWETIIKLYRDNLGDKTFNTVHEYADNFLSFLNNNSLINQEQKDIYTKGKIESLFKKIKEEIVDEFQEKINEIFDNQEPKPTESEFKDILNNIINIKIDEHYQIWKNTESIDTLQDIENKLEEFRNRYKGIINSLKKEIFKRFKLTSAQSRKLTIIAESLFTKFPKEYTFQDYSGLVFFGYGDEEIYPSLKSYIVEGLSLNILKYKEDKQTKISFKNSAAIYPFAQSEMVYTFMEGIDPYFKKDIMDDFLNLIIEYPKIIMDKITELSEKKKEEYLNSLITIAKKQAKKRFKNIENYSKENYIDSIIEVVAKLPKTELASMAESLVNLTTLRRKMSMQAETVGGPIDVAVISKGDGFIWIKRKHYFDPELNKRYIANLHNKILNQNAENNSE
jgi:hypothetical protein